MSKEQLEIALKERLDQLNRAEKEIWANLNYTVGAREEVEKTLKLLEKEETGEGESSPQDAFQLPEEFTIEPVQEEGDAGQA